MRDTITEKIIDEDGCLLESFQWAGQRIDRMGTRWTHDGEEYSVIHSELHATLGLILITVRKEPGKVESA